MRIEVNGLGFRYPAGNGDIFENFSMLFDGGHVTAVLGPSGSGKSTLLNLIAGVASPDRGAVTFHEFGVSGHRPQIGMVFQLATLIPWRTVLSNVLFGAEISGGVSRDHVRDAKDLLSRYGLSGFESRFPHELSGGMQQRVSLIRAVVSGAKVLLLDEPFSHSDFIVRRALQLELSGLIDRRDILVILVTHDLDDALRLADKIVLIGRKPVTVLDSFTVDISRAERLIGSTATNPKLKQYYERIWSSWEPLAGEGNAR